MRSSATQFRVRQVSSAQLRARRRRERVNPLTLGAARENSSKRLIHFHETADENTSLGCSMRLPTAAAYVRTRVHALTKGLKVYSDFDDRFRVSRRILAICWAKFRLKLPNVSNVHAPLAHPSNAKERRQRKKIIAQAPRRNLRNSIAPQMLIPAKINCEMKSCG